MAVRIAANVRPLTAIRLRTNVDRCISSLCVESVDGFCMRCVFASLEDKEVSHSEENRLFALTCGSKLLSSIVWTLLSEARVRNGGHQQIESSFQIAWTSIWRNIHIKVHSVLPKVFNQCEEQSA